MNPVDVDGLSADWLSEALGREVRSMAKERVGTGQMGETYRLTIDADGMPPAIIAKLATGDEASRQRVAEGYRSEVAFYAQVAETVDVTAPGCLFAAITPDMLRFTLLLDDLAPRTPGVQADGCPLPRAEAAVRNLAGLHAPRWNDPSLWDMVFAREPTTEGAAFLGEVATSATAEFVERYAAQLGPENAGTLRDAADALASWALTRIEPFSVVHGDYRLDNLMFGDDTDDVVAVDWQTLSVAPAARDVAYFLGTSLEVDDRRKAEEELVGCYHAELLRRGVEGYDAERCFDDYRLGQLQGPMITTLGCIYAMGEQSERSDAMFLAMATRSCAAIRDLRSLDLL